MEEKEEKLEKTLEKDKKYQNQDQNKNKVQGYFDPQQPISRQAGMNLDDSQFLKKRKKQFQNQHTLSKAQRDTISNENRGDLFKKVQLDVNLQRMKDDILKKARQGMTDKEWDEFHFIPNFFVHGKKFRFSQKSYFLFGTENKFRKSLVWLMEWKYFDMFITFTILSNTVILMFQDYSFRIEKGQEQSWNSELISYSEIVFAIIFIFEFFVKSLAMGLVFEKYTYLREGWNIIDFVVVITSIISFFPQMLNLSLSAIRTFRILRPLRTINYVEGMRILIGSLIESLPDLGNVVVFLTFIITLFGILSLQLFSDVFENRCRLTPWPVCMDDPLLNNPTCQVINWEIDIQVRHLCDPQGKDSCPPGLYCGNPNQHKNITVEQTSQLLQQQLDYPEFNYGYTRFDNIFFAIFTIFQSLTTEGWTNIVFILVDTFNPFIVYVYFICLIFLGSFFVVNLILAVINESFINQHKKNQEKQDHKKRLDQLDENLQQIEREGDKHFKDFQDSIKDDSQSQIDQEGKDDTLQSDMQSDSEVSYKNMHKSIRKKKNVSVGKLFESNMKLSKQFNFLKPVVKSNQTISSIQKSNDNDTDGYNHEQQDEILDQQQQHKMPYLEPINNIQLHTQEFEQLTSQSKQNEQVLGKDNQIYLQPREDKSYLQNLNYENSEIAQLSANKNQVSQSDIEFNAELQNSSGEKQKRQSNFQREKDSKQQTNNTRKETQQTTFKIQTQINVQNDNEQIGVEKYKVNTQDLIDKSPEIQQQENSFFKKIQQGQLQKKADSLENDTSQNSIHCEDTQRFPNLYNDKKNININNINKQDEIIDSNNRNNHQNIYKSDDAINRQNGAIKLNIKLPDHSLNKSDQSNLKINSNQSHVVSQKRTNSVSQRSIKSNTELQFQNKSQNSPQQRNSLPINNLNMQNNKRNGRHSMLKAKSILLNNTHHQKKNFQKNNYQQKKSILRSNKKSVNNKVGAFAVTPKRNSQAIAQKPSLKKFNTKTKFKFVQSPVQKGTLRYKVRYFVEESSIFLLITTSFILANTIVLALDKYPQDASYEYTLEVLNIIFTFVFFGEMLLKLYGQGFIGYVKDRFNIFDGVIVILSLVEVILKSQRINNISGGGFSAITAFRSLRLFRIFKLARSWYNLRHLLLAIYKTLGQIVYFLVLVMLFIIVTCLLGMEFFSYQIRFDESGNVADQTRLSESQSPRLNFDTLPDAIITIFILLTNEEWNSILYDHMRGMESWWPCAFFISVVVIGNFMLLKLFLAILLYNFAKSSIETKEQEEMYRQQNKKASSASLQFTDQIKSKLQQCCQKKKKKKNSNTSSLYIDKLQNGKDGAQEQNYQIKNFGKLQDEQSADKNKDNECKSSTEFNRRGNRKQTYAQNQYQQYMKDIRQLNGKKSNTNKFTTVVNSKTHSIIQPTSSNSVTQNNLDDANTNGKERSPQAQSLPQDMDKIQKIKKGIELFNVVNEIKDTPKAGNQAANSIPLTQPLGGEKQFQSHLSNTSGNVSPRGKASSKFFNALAVGISSQTSRKRINHKRDEIVLQKLVGRSLFILSPQNEFRIWVHFIIKNQKFEAFVIFLIICSSILLTIDSPLDDPTSELQQNLRMIDYFVTFLFVVECLMKILSKGFLFNGNKSYLRSYWNQLDFLIVIISLVSIFVLTDINLDKLKIFRILRILRPLRLISRNKGLKVAINSILKSIPNILNLLVVCLIFFLLFGIFGTNYFKGSFFYCDMTNVFITQRPLIQNKIDCLDNGGDWINNDYNFDNIMAAMLNLFVLSTTEGWVQMMQNGMDSVGIDQAPIFDHRKPWALFYIFFIIVGAFFIMNLFAGIVVDSFNQEKDKIGGISLLTLEQKEWIEVQIRVLNTQPQSKIEVTEQSSFLRKSTFNLVTNQYFEITILVLIIVNTLVFMAVWNGQSQEMQDIIRYLNYGFLALFTIEAILKINSFRIEYFKDVWNQFDLCVVVITYIGLALEYTEVFENIGTSASIVRTFRIVRILRLVKRAKSIQMIFNTFIITIPALANIGALLGLVLFLFAVLGMNLFPFIKYNPSTMGINEKSNFQTFFESFFLLLKCSTGEGWNLVLSDIVRQQSPIFACHHTFSYTEYKETNESFLGCGNSAGYLFLIAFQLLFAMIVLSLFVAVILEGFDKTLKDEHSMVKPHNVFQFVETWKAYDKKAIGLLEARQLISLLQDVDEPLGWNGLKISESRQRILVAQMDLPLYKLRNLQQPFVFYYDVLGELSRQCILSELPMTAVLEPDQKVQAQKDIDLMLKIKLNQYRHLKDTDYTTADFIAVQIMIQRFRMYKKNKLGNQNKENIQNSQDQIIEKPENEESSNNHSKLPNQNMVNNSQQSQVQDMGSFESSKDEQSQQIQTLQSDDNTSYTSGHNSKFNQTNRKSIKNDRSRINNPKKSSSDFSNMNTNILDQNTTQLGQNDFNKNNQNQVNQFFNNQLSQKQLYDEGIIGETYRNPSEIIQFQKAQQKLRQQQSEEVSNINIDNNNKQRTTNVYSNIDLQNEFNQNNNKSTVNINIHKVLSEKSDKK